MNRFSLVTPVFQPASPADWKVGVTVEKPPADYGPTNNFGMHGEVGSQESKRIGSLLLGGILFAAALGAQTPPATEGKEQSQILTAEGKVEVASAGSPDWKSAQPKGFLRAGDRLRTGRRSRATVRLSDLSILRVNELSLLQIEAPSSKDKKRILNIRT